MPKDYKVYIDDIIEAIEKIQRYVLSKSFQQFSSDSLLVDGVIRNLAIIGEAVKNIPAEIRRKYPDIEWKKIAGLRDLLVHQYSGINDAIIWDIVSNKLPELKSFVIKLIDDLK